MKRALVIKLVYSILFIFGLTATTSIYSQTVVQWYTSMGDFRVQLREDLVPVTVQNFVDLTTDEFYDDLIFHRVISNFMIQDGCPNGNGSGGPGYTFDDEFHPDLRHDQPGILSMANSGPNTNGSQYFITVEPTTWLDDVHSVFGKVMDGMDVVYAISEVETDNNDKPLVDVVIDSIRVVVGDPQIELTAPLGGMKWNGHFHNEIMWDSEFIADVKIEFSSDNGTTWSDITESISAHYRSYSWIAPSGLISSDCMIRVSDIANPDVFSITEIPFTLCNMELFTPDGYGFYRVGSPVEVTWDSELVDELILSYSTSEDGDWVTIVEGVPASDNYYLWMPTEASSWCKIQLKEVTHPEAIEESNNRFFVFQLDITSPTGGESLAGWDIFDITWNSEIINAVKIEFSSDSMETWSVIANSVPAVNQMYSWPVPNINSDYCFVKLTSPSLPDMYSINQTAFSIAQTTGIDNLYENNEVQLTIFPNPINNSLTVSYIATKEWGKNCSIEIFNTVGQLVFTNTERLTKYGNQLVKLDLSEYESGLYMLVLSGDTESASMKFIKK